MPVFNWDGNGAPTIKPGFKYYLAVAIPLTILVLGIWALGMLLPWKEWLAKKTGSWTACRRREVELTRLEWFNYGNCYLNWAFDFNYAYYSQVFETLQFPWFHISNSKIFSEGFNRVASSKGTGPSMQGASATILAAVPKLLQKYAP
jgi:hypothetical protein